MLLLLTGEKHRGKTTAAALLACRLHRMGRRVRGILAPALYAGGRPRGFDLVDIATARRVPFARRPGPGEPFTFDAGGLAFGRTVLARCRREARPGDFTLVDEFGPLELAGGGWREEVDRLAAAGRGHLVLVVRRELAAATGALYAGAFPV